MRKIGKFKICGLLGRGGMGKVFKIEYPVTGKIGALKLLDPNSFLTSLIGHDEIEAMFTSEAVKMAGLRHPNIAEILDFDRGNGKLYYIMEFYCNNLGTMIGESYETEKRSRKLPIDKALYYTRRILSGVSRLHFSSIIHRDIKPFNILVTDHDQVKLCDFGLSKLRNETFGGHGSLKIGSPYYASPEQEKDPENVDFSCDLYAVGVMLFRMVTGALPGVETMDLKQLNADLDSDWSDFMAKAIAGRPHDRYASADAMARDLDELNRLWLRKKERICSAPASLFTDDDGVSDDGVLSVRSTPLKISKKEARIVFGTDELMRPAQSVSNRFEVQGDIVRDDRTGLIWQVSGTRFPVNFNQAEDYINILNSEAFGGVTSWRLPTVNELLTIMSDTPEGRDYCLEPVFDKTRKWLWSSDRCTFITSWYVSLELGFVSWNDFHSFYHVKAVSSMPSCVTGV